MALFTKSLRMLGPRSHSLLTKVPARGYADEDTLSITLAAPNKTYYDDYDIKQVDLPTVEGDHGILANHVPTIAILKPGVVTVYEEEDDIKRIFVSSGILIVNEDSTVQVLAEEAHLIKDLDYDAANATLSEYLVARDAAPADSLARKEAEIGIEIANIVLDAINNYGK